MSALAEISHQGLLHYIDLMEGLERSLIDYKNRFPWLTDLFDRMIGDIEAVVSEAMVERDQRIGRAFPDVQIGDRVEHQYPAPDPVPEGYERTISPEGFVVRTGTVRMFRLTSSGPVLIYDEGEQKTGVVGVEHANVSWRKLE